MIKACNFRRLLSLLVSLCMVLSLVNVSAFAAEPCEEHDWGDWELTLAPTADAEGEETQTCGVCGAVETRPVEKLAPEEEITPEEEPAPVEETEPEEVTAPVEWDSAAGDEDVSLASVEDEEETAALLEGPVTTAEALQAAVNASGTVELGGDIVMDTSDIVTVPAGVTVTLDMKGHSITVKDSFAGRPIVNKGTLTVTGNGTIDSSQSRNGYGAIRNDGTLTIENGTYLGNVYGDGAAIRNGIGSKLTVNDGYFAATGAIYNVGKATIYKGEFVTLACSGCGTPWAYALNNRDENGASGEMQILPEKDEDVKVHGPQGALASVGGADVYVQGGTFYTYPCENDHKGNAFYAVYVSGKAGAPAKCVIDDGKFSTTGGNACIFVENTNPEDNGGMPGQGILEIKGGSFDEGENGAKLVKFSGANGSRLGISGGTFSSDVSKYVPESVVSLPTADGKYVVGQADEIAVAKIDVTPYADLASALSAAQANQTVTIVKGGEYAPVTVPAGVTVVPAEGMGVGDVVFKNTSTAHMVLEAEAVLRNVTVDNTGNTASNWIQAAAIAYGKNGNGFTLDGCTVLGSGTGMMVLQCNDKPMTITGCTIKDFERGYYACGDGNALGEVTITGNTFENVKIPFDGYWGKPAADSTELTITGNTFKNGGEPAYVGLWDYNQYLDYTDTKNTGAHKGSALSDKIIVKHNTGNYQLVLVHTDWQAETPKVDTDNENVVYCDYVEVEAGPEITSVKAEWAGEGEMPSFMNHTTPSKNGNRVYFYELPRGMYNVTVTYKNGASVTVTNGLNVGDQAAVGTTQELKLTNTAPKVAKIDNTEYDSIQTAIDACPDGGTVTVLANSSENITLPLKSFTLTSEKDPKPVLTGKVDFAAGKMPDGAEVTIENLAFENTRIMLITWSKTSNLDKMGGLTIRNNTFTGAPENEDGAIYAIHINNGDLPVNNLTITGNVFDSCGTIDQKSTLSPKPAGGGLSATVCGNLTVTDNTFKNSAMNALTLTGKQGAKYGNAATTSATIANNVFENWAVNPADRKDGRAMRLSNFDCDVDLTKNSFFSSNLPEEYIKLTGLAEGKTADVNKCYWGGEAPAEEQLTGVGPVLSYYDDAPMTHLVTSDSVVAQVGETYYTSLQEAFAAAAASESDKTVKLLNDVEISFSGSTNQAAVVIPSGVTLDGSKPDGGTYKIIAKGFTTDGHVVGIVNSENVTVKNLTIVGTTGADHGKHCLNVFGSKNVALENVTLQDSKTAGMVINSSDVKATGLTTSGNAWGAVNVDKGSSFELVSGTLNENAKVWIDDPVDPTTGEGSTVTLPEGWKYITVTDEAGKAQRFYDPNLSLTITEAATLAPTNTVTLEATCNPEGLTVTWASSDATVATVDANGVVTAAGVGTATITATLNGGDVTATCEITVALNVPTVTISASSTNLTGGGTVTLTVTGPEGTTVTSNPTVTITPQANGTYTVYLPNTTASYIFTASFAGNETTAAVSAPVTVNVTRYVAPVTPSRPGTSTGGSSSGGSSGGRGNSGNAATSSVNPGRRPTVNITDPNVPLAELPNTFTDVAEDAYYRNPVLWAVQQGITGGTSATTFSPNNPCTRAQIVTFLYRAAGSPDVTGENPFTDVAEGAYYYSAVLWAVQNGITGGTTDTTFSPDNACTRAQAVTFLHRYEKTPAAEGTNPFTDVTEGAYYYNAVLWAVANSVTGGTTATTFGPDALCSRAQIVTFLFRAMADEG